ncbi:hypothetical protein ACMD2_19700 [Ananas comosus]|uniref:Uncharacterized protein n=1 Tax=Ananas comosus TaxID=4615 RepID=A0A199W4N9_ANACO|nr:hypothetical protein ACMD2_19700 [Ananas comosus]
MVLVIQGRAKEPVARRHDHVVEIFDLGRPVRIGLVQVEIEEAGQGRALRVRFYGPNQRRHIKDCIWFLPTESPRNARDLPPTSSRNCAGLKTGSSHPSGLHRHFMNPSSGRPNFMQFWWSWIAQHVPFV